ncbi:hypothetical protein H5410_003963 [Solanum commersonii]|uniref:Uncharacterized protein n=1 Tax=Solanum commersonii TaxID=4109 RepID=A0A9J6B6A8_SOLCO|nr:hypothetical protein H5410_003963 [Solanum commersonii]
MDDFGSFPAKISVRARMNLYHDFTKLLVQEKNYNDFKVYKETGNASYALYGFRWAFLVWIYEAFHHLDKYAKKSLDFPLPIPRLLRWHTTKSDNIIEANDLAVVDEDYTTTTIDKDGAAIDVDEILPLAIVDEYFVEEVNEQ